MEASASVLRRAEASAGAQPRFIRLILRDKYVYR
jgi:hypothetical protein